MARIHIKNIISHGKKGKRKKNLKECRKTIFCLENGEEIRRGCGLLGMHRTDVGWRCLYCGNYLYQDKSHLDALWFHFRVGREYWRISVSQDKVYINGVPVSGSPDSLPQKLVSDLAEPRPPKWFPYFVCYEGHQFKKYLEKYWNV
ncbi:MAG: hypothetical protein H8E32_11015 [Nitrospinae bacterium]|nr:hypothetical protein [Nitrospinota bacterium]